MSVIIRNDNSPISKNKYLTIIRDQVNLYIKPEWLGIANKIIQASYRLIITLISFILTLSLGVIIPIFLFVLLNIGGQ
jgi:hypothetical protein